MARHGWTIHLDFGPLGEFQVHKMKVREFISDTRGQFLENQWRENVYIKMTHTENMTHIYYNNNNNTNNNVFRSI